MEEQQAGQAVAEAQVGPASEQVDVGQGQTAAPSAEPNGIKGTAAAAKVFVPEEFRSEVMGLVEVKEEWRIRSQCADSRVQKAIAAGDPEQAIIERRSALSAEFAAIDAQTALWDRLQVILGIPLPPSEYALNLKTLEVAPRRQRSIFPYGE